MILNIFKPQNNNVTYEEVLNYILYYIFKIFYHNKKNIKTNRKN